MSDGRRIGRLRRVVRIALWGLTAAHLADALVLWRRRGRLPTLAPAGPAPGLDAAAKVTVLAAVGAQPDAATMAAVAAELEAGAEMVDLVPGELPTERALRLVRRVDAEQLTADVMHSPGGAHEAVALHPSLAERLGHRPAPMPRDPDSVLTGFVLQRRGRLVRSTIRAQRYAPTGAVVRVAPGLEPSPYGPGDRWQELTELSAFARPYVSLPPLLLGAEALHRLVLTAGLLASPVAGLAALAAWSAEPLLVFAGGTRDGDGLRPADLGRAAVLRLPRAWADTIRTARAGRREVRAAIAGRVAEVIPAPPDEDELFEPRRDSCPWCGSGSLAPRLDTTDLFQHKGGHFHLDDCLDCGHVFQNPALSTAGLDHYYDQFYEGLGEELWEAVFASAVKHNRNRVAAMARHAEPRRWLDVGAGHGHFCLTARQRWPDATFDGVDMSETVEEARRRGWVDHAHRGLFVELAEEMPWAYDVVSMHHYLEHTLEPHRELAAAAKVLQPGGHLMIEVPDPASPWARRLGRFWFAWAQPQHLHFIRCEELVAELARAGFEVLSVERGAATLGFDLTGAVAFGLQHLVPSPHFPWCPPTPPAERLERLAVVGAALPLLAAAAVVDAVKDALPRPDRIGNAYRIVARAPREDPDG